MAIDLGSEYLKVSLVKPGKVPISVVVNEMSKRKTPALVGFVNGERLLGEEVASVVARFPQSIFYRARDLLGKFSNDSSIAEMLKNDFLPYTIVEHPTRKTACVKLDDGSIYSAEELVASIFHYAKQITHEQAGGEVLDTVIVVPAFFGQSQRQAIMDAAVLADLNVLSLINGHSAAALQFGIERNFENNTQNIIMYDMGSGSTEVSLVKYSTYTVKEAGKPKVYNQFEVKDVEWVSDLGANKLDGLLVNHFAKQFKEKFPKTSDIFAAPKSLAKLKKQVRRTKEMLSANTMAPCIVEELHEGKDFHSTITREAFEQLAAGFFDLAAKPLVEIMERNNLTREDVAAVELLGGGSRVPRVQTALSEALGGRGLDRHLDADEAVVLGAGLFAANLSTSFRLRKFGMADATMYGVLFKADEVKLTPGAEEDTTAVKNLLPYMKKLPSKRTVHYYNLTGDPLTFTLSYNESTPHKLPPGAQTPELASFEVTGIQGVVDKYNHSGTVNLKFEADIGGVLLLTKAEAELEIEVMEEKIVEVKDEEDSARNTTDTAGAKDDKKDAKTDDKKSDKKEDKKEDKKKDKKKDKKDSKKDSKKDKKDDKKDDKKSDKQDDKKSDKDDKKDDKGDKEGDDKPEVKKSVKKIMVPKKKQLRVALTVAPPKWTLPPLDESSHQAARKVLSDFIAKEEVKRETAAAKNALESYIISTRDSLDSDEVLQKVSTEDQRSSFSTQLTDMEDWLYGDGDAETAAEYKQRLKVLKGVGDPIMERKGQFEARVLLDKHIQSELSAMLEAINSWEEKKPWIGENETKGAQEKVDTFTAWFEEQVAAQKLRKDTEDPAYKVQDVITQLDKAKKAVTRVNNKKKPKPPPVVVDEAANSTTNGTTNGTSNSTGDSIPEEPSKGSGAGDSKEGSGGDKDSKDDSKHDEL